MDYRKFLGQVESVVLPYFGGAHVHLPARRLRVAAPPAPGWWHFEVKGRTATAREPAAPEGLDGLPRVRGHLWEARLVHSGAVAEAVRLLPEDTPPRFAPLLARRWHDGGLVFDALEFETEAEAEARRRWEEGGALTEVKAVPASLRAAFGYATRRPQVWVPEAPEARVERVLARAGAGLKDSRRLGGGHLEVVFDFMGQRFQSLVEADTLRVVDAGLCLDGEDALVTLDSLPAVIREALREDVLVITRHV